MSTPTITEAARDFKPALLGQLPYGSAVERSSSIIRAPRGDVEALVSDQWLGVRRDDSTGFNLWPVIRLERTSQTGRETRQKELRANIESGRWPQTLHMGLRYRMFEIPEHLAPAGSPHQADATIFEHELAQLEGSAFRGHLIHFTGTPAKDPSQQYLHQESAYSFLMAGAVFFTPLPEDRLEGVGNKHAAELFFKAKAYQTDKRFAPLSVIDAYEKALQALMTRTADTHRGRAFQIKLTMAHCYIEQAKLYIGLGRAYYAEARDKLNQVETLFKDDTSHRSVFTSPLHHVDTIIAELRTRLGHSPGWVEKVARRVVRNNEAAAG
ncbi:MAG: hypothetical protein HQM16_18210 [Deltaproteobacteria bacterium]|nr:hypothetical protein [Deltaproteobacteria bacterium]